MTDLDREIEEILALDAKRTPGDWEYGRYATIQHPDFYYITQSPYDCETDDFIRATYKRDAQFIAAAPRMAEIIRELRDENAELKRDMQIEFDNQRRGNLEDKEGKTHE